MDKRKNRRRRRRRVRSPLEYLLLFSAILLIGVMLAAALSPHSAPTDFTRDTQAEQLAGQLADSVTSDTSLPAPIQKGSVAVPVPD